MVRRAETIKSLNELNLTKHAQNQIERRIGTDVGYIITIGRIAALNNEIYPKNARPEYIQELIGVLDEAGFIRNDLYPKTLHVCGLYTAILNHHSQAMRSISSLANRETLISNKEYESIPAVSDEDLGKVIEALSSLSKTEQTVLILRFGLDCRASRNLETIAKKFRVTRERIRQIEARAIRKMRNPSRLCKLPALFGFVPPAEPEVIKSVSADGTETISINTDIYNLGISVRTYNCLKRYANINTIGDVLKYPKGDWLKIRNLGRRCALEVQEKMRTIGYSEFSVE